MRRLLALLAAAGLVATVASSSVAATPSMPTTGFVGDFDVKVDGVVIGHINAVLASVPNQDRIAGSYRFKGVDGGLGVAQVGETAFYRSATAKEVWFKALEIGYPGPGYGIFVGHFIDVLDPAATDYVEFWSQKITYDPDPGGALGGTFQGRFDVGRGTFTLRVPAN
jgi:hypothetical protein